MSVEESNTKLAPPSVAQKLTRDQRKAVFAASVGNAVEYYDWAIYGTFVAIFSPHFFAGGDSITSLLSSLAVFAVGFVARPIGAIVLGSYADRKGRKKVLVLAITITSVSALVIGLVPDYNTIGVFAPIILVLARLAQGFAAGGEGSGAMTFLAESAPPRRRGFVGSFAQVSTGAGILLASLTGTIITALLSEEAVASWGWRAAFIFAAALGVVGLWLRRSVDETEAFKREAAEMATRKEKAKGVSVFEAFRRNPKQMAQVFCLGIPATIMNYLWLTYMPTLAHTTTGFPLKQTLLINTLALAFYCLILPFCGKFSDKFGRKANLYIFTIGFVVFSYPAFELMDRSLFALVVIQFVGVALLAADSAVVASTYNELFPVETRAAGSAVPFALSVAMFGGTAPFIVTWMFSSGYGAYIWLYPAIGALIGLLALIRLPETSKREL